MTKPMPDPNDPSNPIPGGYGNPPSEWAAMPPISGSYFTTATFHASTALAAMRVIEGQHPAGGTGVTVSNEVRQAEIDAAKAGQKLAHERYIKDLEGIKEDAEGERKIDTGILMTGAGFFLVGFVYYMFTKDTMGISVGVSAGLVAFAYRAGQGKLQPSTK